VKRNGRALGPPRKKRPIKKFTLLGLQASTGRREEDEYEVAYLAAVISNGRALFQQKRPTKKLS
jgi:hypothetical protein